MEEYNIRISEVKNLINEADYVLIGAGSGLSTAAGLEYLGRSFEKNFKEFIEKYNFPDLYSASFYDFNTQEEKWAFFAKMIYLNRFNKKPLKLYQELYSLINGKDYFVITTNVDGQFEKAGFEKERVFETQGDYAYLQCERACHNKLYYNYDLVKEWLKNTSDCKIPSNLVPKCPVCGCNMDMNLRKDANFVQDENWYKQDKRYGEFLDKSQNKNLLLLEIGVGFNTPGIIRFPFEQMVYNNTNTNLVRINKDYAFASKEVEEKTILFDEDVNTIIEDLRKEQ